MPLPPEVDQKIRDLFALVLNHAISKSASDTGYYQVKTEFFSLMNFISPSNPHFNQIRKEINEWNSPNYLALQGHIRGLKTSYEEGMFDSLPNIIENNMAFDYMEQAEKLLGEGKRGQNDHVPAAVLAGCILEDRLRKLCQRQTPVIDTKKSNGNYKTLDPMIVDLLNANVFNNAKADMLKSWAKIRNYAAHGEFKEFNRADVEAMITGIKAFLADYS